MYHNYENDFHAAQKNMSKKAGGYHEIKTNSLFLDGKRRTYMDQEGIELMAESGCIGVLLGIESGDV
ncbi:MAG: hypothetical protein GY940_35565 [bacterium]|nr:hypothetical protein [bacterium]